LGRFFHGKKWVELQFGRFFSRTHLVTLAERNGVENIIKVWICIETCSFGPLLFALEQHGVQRNKRQ
jgi:hypothetical protein